METLGLEKAIINKGGCKPLFYLSFLQQLCLKEDHASQFHIPVNMNTNSIV